MTKTRMIEEKDRKLGLTAEEKYELNCRLARFYETGGMIDEADTTTEKAVTAKNDTYYHDVA